MTPSDLRATLATLAPLGMTARRLAALFGYASDNTVRRWLRGEYEVPAHVAAWLREYAAWAERHQPRQSP